MRIYKLFFTFLRNIIVQFLFINEMNRKKKAFGLWTLPRPNEGLKVSLCTYSYTSRNLPHYLRRCFSSKFLFFSISQVSETKSISI